jgi:hypothetical protein
VYDLFYRLTTKWIETECTKKTTVAKQQQRWA